MMETLGDAYGVLLHDDRLRAGLVARGASERRPWRPTGRARVALAARRGKAQARADDRA